MDGSACPGAVVLVLGHTQDMGSALWGGPGDGAIAESVAGLCPKRMPSKPPLCSSLRAGSLDHNECDVTRLESASDVLPDSPLHFGDELLGRPRPGCGKGPRDAIGSDLVAFGVGPLCKRVGEKDEHMARCDQERPGRAIGLLRQYRQGQTGIAELLN